MKRIAIIGGGISGLSAAYTIEKKRQSGTPVQYVLFESSPRLGGVLVTDRVDGCLIEAGPDSFLTDKPWAADLCRKIGLGDQLIGSNDSERKTYIVAKGKLVAMPDGLMFMVPTKIMPTVFSPLFSWSTKMRMAAEWFHPPHKASEDETVAEMVERHYGSEMVDLLAELGGRGERGSGGVGGGGGGGQKKAPGAGGGGRRGGAGRAFCGGGGWG